MYAEYIQQLYVQVQHLPERCREIFNLYFFERQTTKEIAALLNISEQTVRNQKTKAVAILKSALLKKNILPVAILMHFFAVLCAVED
ncbi:hypothetical protein D9M69_721730 [compost metagenome]